MCYLTKPFNKYIFKHQNSWAKKKSWPAVTILCTKCIHKYMEQILRAICYHQICVANSLHSFMGNDHIPPASYFTVKWDVSRAFFTYVNHDLSLDNNGSKLALTRHRRCFSLSVKSDSHKVICPTKPYLEQWHETIVYNMRFSPRGWIVNRCLQVIRSGHLIYELEYDKFSYIRLSCGGNNNIALLGSDTRTVCNWRGW